MVPYSSSHAKSSQVHCAGGEAIQTKPSQVEARHVKLSRVTCAGGEARHGLSPLPEPDVVLEGEDVEDDVQQRDDLRWDGMR
jgi:hypothetical protein